MMRMLPDGRARRHGMKVVRTNVTEEAQDGAAPARSGPHRGLAPVRTIAVSALLFILAGCIPGRSARVAPQPDGFPAVGIASWYGPGFEGRRTASGEIFNAGELTAAHRTLPFGTRVRVENLESGRDVIVRINDRGPTPRDRIIDLSREAARRIGMIRAGLARVRLTVVE